MIKKKNLKLTPRIIRKCITNFYILAIKYGQYYTIRDCESNDRERNIIPWYTYPAIEYLNNINFSDKTIFEYGSGNSSLFWAQRCKRIISVESNEEWFKKVMQKKLSNQEILYKSIDTEYVESINFYNRKFDVIIIDGKHRLDCAIKSIKYIKPNGMIILDNTDRDLERDVAKYIREHLDYIQIDFHGFGPINNYTWTTSIFFSRSFNFKIKNDLQPISTIGNWQP